MATPECSPLGYREKCADEPDSRKAMRSMEPKSSAKRKTWARAFGSKAMRSMYLTVPRSGKPVPGFRFRVPLRRVLGRFINCGIPVVPSAAPGGHPDHLPSQRIGREPELVHCSTELGVGQKRIQRPHIHAESSDRYRED